MTNNTDKDSNGVNKKDTTKILIVEDEIKLQKLLNKKVTRAGWEVETASNGEEALRRVKESKPALMLLDLRMPIMGGFEMLEELRKDYDEIDLPVIVLTNYGESDNVARATELKAESFLVKSNYSLDEIVDKIKQTLAR